MEEFFVQFLAGAKADKLDFNVATGPQAGKADHLLGQINDFDRLAHVENADLAAKLGCLGLRCQRCCL